MCVYPALLYNGISCQVEETHPCSSADDSLFRRLSVDHCELSSAQSHPHFPASACTARSLLPGGGLRTWRSPAANSPRGCDFVAHLVVSQAKLAESNEGKLGFSLKESG